MKNLDLSFSTIISPDKSCLDDIQRPQYWLDVPSTFETDVNAGFGYSTTAWVSCNNGSESDVTWTDTNGNEMGGAEFI